VTSEQPEPAVRITLTDIYLKLCKVESRLHRLELAFALLVGTGVLGAGGYGLVTALG
jgi:hypothetical protein